MFRKVSWSSGAKSASVRTLYCRIPMILGTCSIEAEQFSWQ